MHSSKETFAVLPALGSWTWDIEVDTVTWTKELFRFFGLDPSMEAPNWEAHGRLFTPESFEKLQSAVSQCLKKGTPYFLILEGIHTSGQKIHLDAYGAAERNDEGQIKRLLGQIVDRTDLIRVSKELKYHDDLFHSAFENATIGMALVSLEGKWLKINPALRNILGYSSEELREQTWQEMTHPDDLEADLVQVGQLLAGEISTYAMGKRFFHKSGSIVWGLLSVSLARDDEGKPLHFISQIQDITGRRSKEEQLRLSNDALKNISQGVLITDANRLIISVNKAFADITGYSEGEILGKNCKFLQGPQTDAETVQKIRNALNNGVEFSGQIQNYRKDGTIFWNELSISPVRDERGQVIHYVGIVRDVTARIIAEKTASEKTGQLRAILESPIGMVFFSLDRDYCYAEFSQSHFKTMKTIWGEEIKVGMNMLDFISDPADKAKTKGNFDHVLQGNHLILEEEYGDRNLQRSFYENHYSPIRDAGGGIVGISVFVIDITEKQQQQQKLESFQSRELFQRLLVANLAGGVGVWDWNIATDTLLWDDNMYRQYGITENTFGGAYVSWKKGIHPDDRERCEQEAQMALRGEKEFNTNFRVVWPDGSIHHLRAMAYVKRDDSGLALRMIGTNWDITEEKQRELLLEEKTEQALSANRTKTEFLGVMSHELRTPLNGILGFSDLMLEESQISPDVRDNITIIRECGGSLLRILDEILDFSHVEGGALKLQISAFSLSELTWKAIRIIESDANAKSLQLSVVIGEKVPATVLGDQGRIQQVLLNLLRNAVKFTEHGSITLKVDLGSTGWICFAVEDTGIGIAAEQQERIFLPFTQMDNGLNRKFDGIGIGLTISQRLLEKMGSELRVQSKEGKGSIFSFDLNLPNAASGKQTEASGGFDLGVLYKGFAKRFPMRILAVEDNPINLKVLVTLLGTLGYMDVLTATNGEAALSLLEREKVDMILMDLQMPIMNGIEATRQIRLLEAKNPSVSPVRIVAVTANVSITVRKECFAAGMDNYVSKPFNARTLADAIYPKGRQEQKILRSP